MEHLNVLKQEEGAGSLRQIEEIKKQLRNLYWQHHMHLHGKILRQQGTLL